MARHKNQHFVPRCYLRAFSRDNDGRAINLFHIASDRFVQDAPVKGQCARPYIYGHDLKLERALQGMEGEYAQVFSSLSNLPTPSMNSDLQMLREFMLLQASRTKAAILRTQQVIQGIDDQFHADFPGGLPRASIDFHNMMLMTLGLYVDFRKSVTDLKLSILKNRTSIDFITCDDPVVFSSMYHAKKLKTDRFGFGSAGALFFFPLSPRLLLLAYDGDVYSLSNKRRGVVPITRETDVYACNELQYLNASHSVYFQNWSTKERIRRELRALQGKRRQRVPILSRFVPQDSSPLATRYRQLDAAEDTDADEILISTSLPHLFPNSWISSLRFRKKLRYFSDGSAAGHVRIHTVRTDPPPRYG